MGGGFIKIDDFIAINSQNEVSKIYNRDKIKSPEAKSPDPIIINRIGSPKAAYNQRLGLNSSIPVPKSVTSLQLKKNPVLETPKKVMRKSNIS